MSETRIANRYATSLVELATKQGILSEVENDVRAFLATLEGSRDLSNLLKSPIIYGDKKRNILHKLFGSSFNKLTLSFIDLVVRKKREVIFDTILREFVSQVDETRNRLSAKLTLAQPVSKEVVEKLIAYLEKTTGKSVEVDTQIDPDILGGFVVKYGDRLIDASVASQLQSLEKHLLNNN